MDEIQSPASLNRGCRLFPKGGDPLPIIIESLVGEPAQPTSGRPVSMGRTLRDELRKLRRVDIKLPRRCRIEVL